jgi:lipoate---protein ligase
MNQGLQERRHRCMEFETIMRGKAGIMLDFSFKDPADNLCFDDTLLQCAEAGRLDGILRFWESGDPFVVLGRSGDPAVELQMQAVSEDGVPVYRRSSGGGTVVQGPGCLNYAIVLPKEGALADVRASYRTISEWLLRAMGEQGIMGHYEPISDLALAGRKFSGNAQRRGRRYLMQHGTILYRFETGCISRWLSQPRDQPPYRANRSHTAFVANVNLDPIRFKRALAKGLGWPMIKEPDAAMTELLQKRRDLGVVEQLLVPAGKYFDGGGNACK